MWLSRRPLRLCQIWCKSVDGASGQMGENCLYLFFMNSPTGQTRRRIFTLDGSNDADSRKDVGFVDTALHFRGKIPENPNFGGVNSRFQAKRTKYWKFHVIETNASIPIKFCTTIETIKWSSWVVPIGTQQIQDGVRLPFWKKVKSPYFCNRLTDFDKIWYDDAYWPHTADQPLIQDGGNRHLENDKNCDISAAVWPIFTKFGTLTQNGFLIRSDG